jgi:hypothetical protein
VRFHSSDRCSPNLKEIEGYWFWRELRTSGVIDDGLRYESSLFAHLFSTKDLAEGLSAFFSKRKPEFKGE